MRKNSVITILFFLICSGTCAPKIPYGQDGDDDVYQVGIGIADITGPAAEVNMMGYAKFGQDTSGLHTRLYARTFIVEDKDGHRVVYISADIGMIDQAVKTQVAATLNDKYSGLYNVENVLISGTHTHSSPGGFLQYLLYTIVSQGFTKQTFDAVVNGIVLSVDRAHANTQAGYIYWNQGELLDASINRSPTAYLNNSVEERSRYKYDTDKDMYLLKFTDTQDNVLGVLNWFAVHPTSMNNTNKLISGDNKGQASLMFEAHVNTDSLPGKGAFVAAFASANLGDVSPNLKGPHCQDTGLPCEVNTTSCGGKSELCYASGPGKDMFESTKIIATRQFEKALELFGNATEKVHGPVSVIHQHIDMTNVVVKRPGEKPARTCKPAMGYSFAAGTMDGPGAFDFKQGTTSGNPFWNFVRDFISKPSKEMIECHQPKPILLATGQMNFPYAWQPSIVPTQIVRIGNVFITAVPGEFTTMSGRRLKEMIADELTAADITDHHVVLSGLSNAYSSYVATFEEYQIQRYEGASTIFGPYTLDAYLQQYQNLIQNLTQGQQVPSGPDPPNLISKQISMRPGVVFDSSPRGKPFGTVLTEPDDFYVIGSTVSVTFVAGHPRNNLQLESSFLTVERLDDKTGQWKVIATDGNLNTKFIWKRTNAVLGQSTAKVLWETETGTVSGLYRIGHTGSYRTLFQQVKSYTGTSKSFKVGPSF